MRRILGKLPEWLPASFVCLALTAILLRRANLWTAGSPSFATLADHHKYLYMATHRPFSFHIAPYCWRVGGPLVASLLPFDIQWSFLFISFVCVWLTGVLTYYLLIAFDFNKPFAIAGAFFFYSLPWATKWLLSDFWLPDAPAFLITVALLICAARTRDLWFLALLAVGACVKESTLFVIPLYYTLAPARLKRLALLVLPALLMLAALRLGVRQLNTDPNYVNALPAAVGQVNAGTQSGEYSYVALIRELAAKRLGTLSPYAITVGTFGVLCLLPLLSIRRNLEVGARFFPFLILVYGQLLFAVDTERILVLGFPALIILSLNGLRRFADIPVLLFAIGLTVVNIATDTAPLWIQLVLFLVLVIGSLRETGARREPGARR